MHTQKLKRKIPYLIPRSHRIVPNPRYCWMIKKEIASDVYTESVSHQKICEFLIVRVISSCCSQRNLVRRPTSFPPPPAPKGVFTVSLSRRHSDGSLKRRAGYENQVNACRMPGHYISTCTLLNSYIRISYCSLSLQWLFFVSSMLFTM